MQFFQLKTPLLKENFNLEEEILRALKKNKIVLYEKDILIITSKVVALAEGRIINLEKIKPSKRALSMKRSRYGISKENPRIVELILREADIVAPGSMLLTLKNNIFIASAGIDVSNAPQNHVILWPKNPQKTAIKLWRIIRRKFRITNLGIIITDSHCQPLRWGVTGIAIAWAGFEGIEDSRGQKDLYGKKLRITRKAVGDNLASAALVLMGESNERIPFVLCRGAPVKFTNRIQTKRETFIHPKDCLFEGIYSKKFLKLIK